MKVSMPTFVVAVICITSSATAATIDVDTVIGPTYPHLQEAITVVDGIDPPTDVTILEGAHFGTPFGPTADIALELFGSSRALMLGGFVQGNSASIVIHDRSRLEMRGGEIRSYPIKVYDNGVVKIRDGAYDVYSYDSSRLFIGGQRDERDSLVRTFGGSRAVFEAGLDEFMLEAADSSTVVVRGGEFHQIFATDNSRILVDGGYFSDTSPRAYDNAIVDIWSIDAIAEEPIAAVGHGIVNIYGTDLRFVVIEDHENSIPYIVGKLADGDRFAAEYRIYDQGQIILHEVPEPSSLALAVMAVVCLAIHRRNPTAPFAPRLDGSPLDGV